MSVTGLVLGLGLGACGLRVPGSQVRNATGQALGQNGGGSSANGNGGFGSGTGQALSSGPGGADQTGTGSGPGGANQTGTGPTGATGTGSGSGHGNGTGNAGTGSPTGGQSGQAGQPGTGSLTAARAPSGGNGGATAVGVTATSITVGNVSDLQGPVPGLFEGGPFGTQAYFDYVNSLGGVYGRQIKLITSDDQLDCTDNEADYDNLVSKVFGFVGSWSLDDSCGAQVMAAHPGVPMVQFYLSPQMGDLPNAYGVAPFTAHAITGPYEYFKSLYPNAITSVGTLVGGQASAEAQWGYYEKMMQSLGYHFSYVDEFPPAQSNFTADVIRMKAEGVKMVYLIAVNAPDAAVFAAEAAQQDFKPQLYLCVVCYAGSYIQEAGGPSAVDGQYQYLTYAPFLGDSAVPEVSLYLKWLHYAYPSFSPDEFSAYSWANAALFVNALERAGPDLTQAKLLSALKSTTTFTDNGMSTAAQIGAKQPSQCYLITQIQNGQYTKVADPSTGFRCDGTFV